MEIALIADDGKKELMAQFCIAYSGILSKHHICATQTTGKYVKDATDLDIEMLMSGSTGGCEQIQSRISFNEIDILFFFRDTEPAERHSAMQQDMLRLCDVYSVPVATNLATAEVLVMALDRGELDWRKLVNPYLIRRSKGTD
ncbi:MAG: methylglyoxal synthase [Clostridia bacterium]|jgi:methylglyoxal synthase|nr:methylglyoxal synthase [Clostridia bacterium]MBR5044157.1 methylglyoxal synthase [Clostridia bacterium]MBR6052891.1 methylglyoxal synthase [Clostridia bacterium]